MLDRVRPGALAALTAGAVLAWGVRGCACRWEAKGPFNLSGAIRHVIVDPADARRLYAAAENGGVWVLDDVESPGSGWRPLSDRLENLQMRGLAKSRVRSGYIAAANALGYVYHSRNHGRTWARITDQSFQYVRRILITERTIRDPGGSRWGRAQEITLWVACRRGLYTLRLVNGRFDRVTKLFPHGAGDADVLDALLHPLDRRVMYVGVRGEGIWSSTNGGAGWDLVADWATFGDPQSPMIKLATTASGSRVVAKMGRNVVLHNQGDDSADWVQAAHVGFERDIGGSDIGYRGNYSTVKGEWCHAVAIHPTDTEVIAVGQQGLFLSVDGGASWTRVDSGHEDVQSLTFSPSGHRLYIGNDGGVYRREIGTGDPTAGVTTDLNTDLVTMQFYRVGVQGDTAVGPADHMGIRGTTNLGDDNPHWERATANSSGYGINGLENNFVTADPRTEGRFFVQFGDDNALLRLRYPRTGTTEDLLIFNDPATPLRTFTAITNNNAVFNQLNYAVNTVAVDPTPGSSIILTSVHEVPNSQFGLWMTRDGGADPTGGPRRTCGDSSIGAEGWTPRRAGDETVWDEFECNAATKGSVFYKEPVLNTSAWEPTSLTGLPTPLVSIVFSPHKPGKAFALEESGVVWAKDAVGNDGENWRQLGAWAVDAGDYARQIIVNPVSLWWSLGRHRGAERLYAISHRKFVRSRNGGQFWTETGGATIPDDQQLNSICAHPGSSTVLYLATSRDVLISRNRGRSWASIGKRLPNAPVMQVFTDGGYLYAVTFGRGLWRMKLHRRRCRNR